MSIKEFGHQPFGLNPSIVYDPNQEGGEGQGGGDEIPKDKFQSQNQEDIDIESNGHDLGEYGRMPEDPNVEDSAFGW